MSENQIETPLVSSRKLISLSNLVGGSRFGFRTQNNPTTYSVSDSIVSFTPAPTPHSHCSISDTHKFMGFFHNRTTLRTSSATPTTYSVSDRITTFTLAPTHTHSVRYFLHTSYTPPPSTLPRSSRSRALRSCGFLRV